jgi:glycosyltransferase involved in cell wall biosynthesis
MIISNPKVSIIITCYNYDRFVSDAINSALNQTYSNVEVIVVNDGSTDESHDVISQFADRITYVNQINTGVATARNNGLQIACGQYCSCLDADDWISPDYISDAVKLISDDSTIVSPILHYTDENLNIIESDVWPNKSILILNKITIRSLMLGNCVTMASVFPKSKWEQVGGYNPLNPKAEDWEFWIDLMTIGCQVLYMNQNNIYLLYRQHGPSRFKSVSNDYLWNYMYTRYGIFEQKFSRKEKIQALYRFILQREADTDGLVHYLNSGLDIYELFEVLYNSDEFNKKQEI